MAETNHSAVENQSHFDVRGFTMPAAGVGVQYATVVTTTQGAAMSQGHQTLVQMQMNANQWYCKMNAKTTIVLGALQVLAGFLAIAFQAAATTIECISDVSSTAQYLGWGIWCGTVFLITGILGIQAGRKNAKSVIISLLIFSIIASVLAWTLIAFAAINIFAVKSCPLRRITIYRDEIYYQDYVNDGVPATRLMFTTVPFTDDVTDWSLCTGVTGKVLIAMDCVLIIIALFEFAVSVTTASICGRARPCCGNSVPVLLVHPSFSAPAGSYPYSSSMQSNVLSQGNLLHDQALPNFATEKTGPM